MQMLAEPQAECIFAYLSLRNCIGSYRLAAVADYARLALAKSIPFFSCGT